MLEGVLVDLAQRVASVDRACDPEGVGPGGSLVLDVLGELDEDRVEVATVEGGEAEGDRFPQERAPES